MNYYDETGTHAHNKAHWNEQLDITKTYVYI